MSPDRRLCRLHPLLVLCLLATVTPGSSRDWHLPSFLGSNSGVTKPERRQRPSRIQELQQQAGGSSVCGGSASFWSPWPEGYLEAAPTLKQNLKTGSLVGDGEDGERAYNPSEVADDEDVMHLLGVEAEEEDIEARDGSHLRVAASSDALEVSSLEEAASPRFRNASEGGAGDAEVVVGRRLLTYPGFNPLGRMCKGDGSRPRSSKLSPGQQLLAQCLKEGAKCRLSAEEAGLVEQTVRQMPGVKLLLRRPKCNVLNARTCKSGEGNQETSDEFQSDRMKKVYGEYRRFPAHRPAARDLTWGGHGSCAIVGNSPSLKTHASGDTIDRHDSVFRINVIGSGPLSLQPSPGTGPPEREPRFTGRKTSFRVFSKLVAWWLASGRVKIRPKPGERWLFWHHHARQLLPGIRNRVGPQAALLQLAPAQVNWQVAVYFLIRQDLYRLGLGKYSCPRNINSGVKAVFLATHICKSVDVYGISYTERSATKGHLGNAKHKPTRFHAWDFDSVLLRLLHLGRLITICTQDK